VSDETVKSAESANAPDVSAVVSKGKAKPNVWCFTTYFTEGFPFAIVRMMSSVFFTDIGMKERYLGYLNFLGIPWNLKFLWAPLVDIFGSKRSWMIAIQSIVTLLTLAVAVICYMSSSAQTPFLSTSVLVGLFIAFAFIAATNDIIIDGYYIEGIPDQKEQAAYTGYRVFAYRIALVAAKFGIIYAVGMKTKSVIAPGGGAAQDLMASGAAKAIYTAWAYGFGAAGVLMALFTLYHLVALPDFSVRQKAIRKASDAYNDFFLSFASYLQISLLRAKIAIFSGLSVFILGTSIMLLNGANILEALSSAFLIFLALLIVQSRPIVALSLIFIVFYKIGDEIIFSMGTPFLKRYLQVTNAQLAWMTGLIGLVGSIVGTTLGGLWIKKTGLKKAIWPLTLIMNVNIAAYIWLAWAHPLATNVNGLITICGVYCYEQIAAGLGNAVLIVYILKTCKKEFKAGHYAIGSAFMSVFSSIFGGYSGIIVEKMGYMNLFVIGLIATIPAMVLMFFVRIPEELPVEKNAASSK
jgi:PAT family beta-lactamase induction signal transducer AmpG